MRHNRCKGGGPFRIFGTSGPVHMTDLSADISGRGASDRRVLASELLVQLAQDVPENGVSFGWLADYLLARSPEVLILALALIGTLPGISAPVGIVLAILSLPMISTFSAQSLPRFIAVRRLSSLHLVHTIERTVPLVRWSEKFVRRRDGLPALSLRPVAGLAILALSLTMLVPLPFSNVIPSLAIGFIAFALIEADGLLLFLGFAVAVVSLAITTAALWATFGVFASGLWG